MFEKCSLKKVTIWKLIFQTHFKIQKFLLKIKDIERIKIYETI